MSKSQTEMPQAVVAKFDAIRLRFVEGLPTRLAAIEDATHASERQALLHQLAGAAGGYGYDALGLIARDAMAAIDQADQAALDQHLSTLAATITGIVSNA